ncbi:7tm Odorant receptor [Popillia japonica]|uniref:7tm Odorant receptor n=1 Tax=Popillia japonica TaxID=7064 RepID=A0AAW1L674_POPJA
MNVLSMCGYSGVAFAQMATYHILGNEVIYKSDKIIESSCTSKWYQLDIQSKRTLLLLMERAKRPLIVKLYKFVFISLDSLGVIVRWAYSVFALIKARYG